MSRLQFWSFFAIALAIFLFSTGPVWRSPWRMATLNMAVLYSYLPLPVMVAAGLAYRRRLGLRAFFLDTLALTLLKYSATFGIALVLWTVVPPPPAPPPAPAGLAAAGVVADPAEAATCGPSENGPRPTPIAPGRTGKLSGVVLDAAGHPRKGALAFVEAGLEGYVFADAEAPLVLENDGTGIAPRVVAAQLRQPILARSTDGHLHTLVAVKEGVAAKEGVAPGDGPTLFNVPLLSSGAPKCVRWADAPGFAELRCAAHQHTEKPAHLAVFAHPFFAFTGEDGRFSFPGVPAGALRVAAWDPELGRISREVNLEPGGQADVKLPLGQ